MQEKVGVRQTSTSRQYRVLRGTDFVVGGHGFVHCRWSLGGGCTMPGAHRHVGKSEGREQVGEVLQSVKWVSVCEGWSQEE